MNFVLSFLQWTHLFTALSLLTGAIHIFSFEYFWGLELLRPVLLWIVAAKNTVPMKQILAKTFLRWAPYLALLSWMVIWRVFFAQFTTDGYYFSSDPNAPVILINLFKSPLETIPGLVQLVFRDTLHILLNSWSHTTQPDAISLDSRASLISWGIAFLAAVTVGVYYTRTYQNKAEGVEESPLLENQILILGFYALLLGMAPSWAVGHQASSQGPFDNRYALPAMLGASLIVSGFVHSLRSPVYRTLILALLVGLAVGANFRSGNDYRWDWTYQQRFFWQLYWRAPTLKPNTFILSDTEIFKYESARIDLGPALNVELPLNICPERANY